MAEVRLEGVTKQFANGSVAVAGLDLLIRDQEFVVFVGPSGCGKTTTLRMVAGLEQPTRGSIRIGERDVTGLSARERNIALVFQNYALYPHMTVYKNMAFALLQRGNPKAEIQRKVQSVASMLQIQDLLDRKPGQLSGGQRQRVALGRAIVRNPDAFLFDEPLSNLDAKLRVVTRAELKNLHNQLRTTSIYVTHDQEEAMTLADRIVVMDRGIVQQVAAPLEIYDRPANLFVAGFLGMPPMNLLAGRLAGKDGNAVFINDGLTIPVAVERTGTAQPEEDIVLGIRPEDLQLYQADEGAPASGGIEGRVVVTEPLGSLMDVHVRDAADRRLIARIPMNQSIGPGQHVVAMADCAKVHLFKTGTYGANLRPG